MNIPRYLICDTHSREFWLQRISGRTEWIRDVKSITFVLLVYLSKVIHLSCFYLPPNETIRDFIEFLNNKIFPLIQKNVNFMLRGDFNVNLYNPLHLTPIDEFVNSLSGQGYFPKILKPTKLSPENPITKYSLLDQMWCNSSGGYDCLSGVINCDLLDHMLSYYIYEIAEKFKILFENRDLYIWMVASTNLFVQFLWFQFVKSVLFKTHQNRCQSIETMYKAYYE